MTPRVSRFSVRNIEIKKYRNIEIQNYRNIEIQNCILARRSSLGPPARRAAQDLVVSNDMNSTVFMFDFLHTIIQATFITNLKPTILYLVVEYNFQKIVTKYLFFISPTSERKML